MSSAGPKGDVERAPVERCPRDPVDGQGQDHSRDHAFDHERDFAEMARQMHEEPTVEQTTERIVKLAVDTVACDSAGIFLLHGGRRVESAAATDPLVEQADQQQLACGQGPCLEAIEDHTVFVIADTATESRWAPWPAFVADLGYRSVLSLRLFGTRDTTGALNLYSFRVRAFTADDIAIAGIFANHASTALESARTESTLRQAVDARHIIGQGQGILMERFGLTADQAFSVLLRYSQDKNVKLRQVAETIVSSRRLPG